MIYIQTNAKKVNDTDKRLLRFILIGSAISLSLIIFATIYIYGMNLLITLGLIIGSVIGIAKIQFSAKVFSGLIRNDESGKSVTLLNIFYYLLSWGVIILLFMIAYKIALSLLIALAGGILLVPMLLLVYSVVKGAGLLKN